jgi:hypothetical protein
MKAYIKKEWARMVRYAEVKVKAPDAIIEDEVILEMNKYIKELEEYKFMYESVSK